MKKLDSVDICYMTLNLEN